MEIPDIRNITPKITNQDMPAVRKHNAQTGSQSAKSQSFDRSDALVLSEEGKKALEIERYSQMGKSLPAVREDIINKVKGRMQSGFYSNGEVLKDTARKMLGS